MKLTLKTRIYNYLMKKGDWTHKGILSDKAKEAGYSPENCGRRLRELHESGAIERRLNDKGHVLYRISEGTKGDIKVQKGTWIFVDDVAKYVQM